MAQLWGLIIILLMRKCQRPGKDLRFFRDRLRIRAPVFVYPQDRTRYHTCGNTGRKVFAKVIDVVYNEGSFKERRKRLCDVHIVETRIQE